MFLKYDGQKKMVTMEMDDCKNGQKYTTRSFFYKPKSNQRNNFRLNFNLTTS
jgi:hypothetical protein